MFQKHILVHIAYQVIRANSYRSFIEEGDETLWKFTNWLSIKCDMRSLIRRRIMWIVRIITVCT